MGTLQTIPPIVLGIGGAITLLTLGAQMLIGYRKIQLKGKSFLKVHKRVAWLMLVFALGHSIGGLLFVLSVL